MNTMIFYLLFIKPTDLTVTIMLLIIIATTKELYKKNIENNDEYITVTCSQPIIVKGNCKSTKCINKKLIKNRTIQNKKTSSNKLQDIINTKFKGINISLYLENGDLISGEAVFNFDGIISVKSEEGTYFIKPDSVDLFSNQ